MSICPLDSLPHQIINPLHVKKKYDKMTVFLLLMTEHQFGRNIYLNNWG